MPGQWTRLYASDGFAFDAWTAQPDGPLRGAVVVAQEIFGVNSHIRAVTERLAARGFLAIAPDLFARIEPGLDRGYTPDHVAICRSYKERAEAMPEAVLQQVRAAAQWALTQQPCKVGMVGFCWGGLLTWRAAAQLPRAVGRPVCYYGGGMTSAQERARQPLCPVQAHFGRRRPILPLDGVLALPAAPPSAGASVPVPTTASTASSVPATTTAAPCRPKTARWPSSIGTWHFKRELAAL